jgi:hypothetical protein
MEMLEVCRRSGVRLVLLTEDGMAMGSPLSPIVSSVYTEHFEKRALHSAQHKLSLRLRYIADIFMG